MIPKLQVAVGLGTSQTSNYNHGVKDCSRMPKPLIVPKDSVGLRQMMQLGNNSSDFFLSLCVYKHTRLQTQELAVRS